MSFQKKMRDRKKCDKCLKSHHSNQPVCVPRTFAQILETSSSVSGSFIISDQVLVWIYLLCFFFKWVSSWFVKLWKAKRQIGNTKTKMYTPENAKHLWSSQGAVYCWTDLCCKGTFEILSCSPETVLGTETASLNYPWVTECVGGSVLVQGESYKGLLMSHCW